VLTATFDETNLPDGVHAISCSKSGGSTTLSFTASSILGECYYAWDICGFLVVIAFKYSSRFAYDAALFWPLDLSNNQDQPSDRPTVAVDQIVRTDPESARTHP
jgi:hypothetical protein